MKHTYVIHSKEKDTITKYFAYDSNWSVNIHNFFALIERLGYTVEMYKEVRAKIAYTLRNDTAYQRKTRTYQHFDIPANKSWVDVWLEYVATEKPNLWLSHSCKVSNGCVELVGLWIQFELIRATYTGNKQ